MKKKGFLLLFLLLSLIVATEKAEATAGFGSTFSDATEIEIDESYTLNLQHYKEEDMVKFTVPFTDVYTIYTKGSAVQLNYTLFDSSGNGIYGSSLHYAQTGGDFLARYQLEAGETYYVKVNAIPNEYSFRVSTFSLSVVLGTNDDYGNDRASAQLVKLAKGSTTTMSGTLEDSADSDFFKFVAPVTGTYRVYTTKATGLTSIGVYDNITTLKFKYAQQYYNQTTSIEVDLVAKQGYYFAIRNYMFPTSITGDYIINIDAPS